MTPRGEMRSLMLAAMFVAGFGAVGARMSAVALSEPEEPALEAAAPAHTRRGEIVDRAGRLLAINIPAWSAYAHPHQMIDTADAAKRLSETLEGVDEAALRARLDSDRNMVWIKRPLGPREMQAAHDLGLPGVYFGAREARLYPAGRIGAHVLGGVRVGQEWTSYAELIGLAGAERAFDDRLSAQAGAPPHRLRLSLDLPAQAALTDALRIGISRFDAKGAAGVLMEAGTGRLLALASLPDFDPNDRPDPNDDAVRRSRALSNRAAESVFELGSTFKPIYAALAMERGLVGPDTMIETKGPFVWGRNRIRDFHRMDPQMSLTDVMVKSSNVGTAHLAMMIGTASAKNFMGELGFFEPTPLELAEARLGKPLLPRRWGDIHTITIGYGHGLAATPLHLASAYAAMVNGGLRVRPTLNPDAAAPGEADRVLSERTSARMRAILRAVVQRGTGRSVDVPGYEVGGKTGTAEKPGPGGYQRDKVVATFAAAFPMSDPRYVLIITLDEAENREGDKPRRTAGTTAGPVAYDAISRLAPMLGLRPALPQEAAPEPISVAARN